MSNSSQSTVGQVILPIAPTVLWEELLEGVILHFTPLCSFIGQLHVFAGQVKIVSHSSCRTKANIEIFLSPAY